MKGFRFYGGAITTGGCELGFVFLGWGGITVWGERMGNGGPLPALFLFNLQKYRTWRGEQLVFRLFHSCAKLSSASSSYRFLMFRDCTRISENRVMESEQVVSALDSAKKRLEWKHRELDMERRIRKSILNPWLIIFMTIGGLGVVVHAVDQHGLDMEPYILVLASVGVLANVVTAFTASMRVESSVDYFLVSNGLDREKVVRESKTSPQWKWFFLKHVWVPIGLIVCMSIVACLTMVFLTTRAYKGYGQGVVSVVTPS